MPERYRTEEVYLLACKANGIVFKRVPSEFISKQMCENAVSSCGSIIEYIPDEYKTPDIYLLAAQNDAYVMQKMPIELIDAHFCIEVIRKKGVDALSSLPKSLKSGSFYTELVKEQPELIWSIPKAGHTVAVSRAVILAMGFCSTAEAVRANPKLLSQLHTSLYDYDTCLAFVQSDYFEKQMDGDDYGFNTDSDRENGRLYLENHYYWHYSLKHILKWPDICDIVVDKLPICIRYIDDKILTYNMCLKAVNGNYRMLSYVPNRYKSHELCFAAFEKDPYSIEDFTEDLITYELYLEAVRRSGYIFEKTPQVFIDREMCLAAVRDIGSLLKKVPKDLLDEDICLAAFSSIERIGGYKLLQEIPDRLRTIAVCEAAVKADSSNFQFVPGELRTYELSLVAAEKASFIDLPEAYYTEELCLALVKNTAIGFKNIPKNKLTERVCLAAINHGEQFSGTVLKYIPHEIITQEMCDKAVEISVWSLVDVPDEFVTEEMLMSVAGRAPGRVTDNFPERFRNRSFIEKMVKEYPDTERYVFKYL